MGIGSNGEIYRLDLHPSMSKHPVTPAKESDLRLILSEQTNKKTGLIDILQIERDIDETEKKINDLAEDGNEVILFDAIYPQQLTVIGKLMDDCVADKPLFSVGSSGIEIALGSYWNQQGLLKANTEWATPTEAAPLLVLSGSCSPVTERQIDYALEHGFADIALDTAAIAVEDHTPIQHYVSQALQLLGRGQSVIIHVSRSNQDDRIGVSNQILSAKGLNQQEINSETAKIFGTALGRIAKEIAATGIVSRILIAGGDTSSHAARAMGIEAVEMIAPLAPGAPLCKAYAPDSPVDGLEVNFKGGQVGSENYFEQVLRGTIAVKTH